jgi:hypothetical protein
MGGHAGASASVDGGVYSINISSNGQRNGT